MDQNNLNAQPEVLASQDNGASGQVAAAQNDVSVEPQTSSSQIKASKKLFNYFLLGVVFVLIAGVVAIIVWATLDSRNSNTAGRNVDTNATITNQNSATATTDATNGAESTMSATPTATATSSQAASLPNGWRLLTDEATGVKYGLPVQSSYSPIDLNPVNDQLPKEWYVEPNYFDTLAQEDDTRLWGLKLFDDLLSFKLANYPGRQESGNFACGGLCAGQDEIIVTLNKGNKDTIQSMLNNLNLAVESYNAFQQNNNGPLRISINNLQISKRWGADVASYMLELTGGMGDELETYYYLVANGRNAYAINTFGVDKNAVDQVLNTLVLP